MKHPKGYRFRPTDEELIIDFLIPKICGNECEPIGEVEFLKNEPWELPAFSKIESDDQFWYFLYKLEKKYKKSNRANRVTANGFWKITGQVRKVYSSGLGLQIGIKRNLTFYKGRTPTGRITNWVIHEYTATSPQFPPNPGNYVICCLKKTHNEKDEDSSPEGVQFRCSVPFYYNSVSGNTSPEDNQLGLQNFMNNVWLEEDHRSQLEDQITMKWGQNLAYADSSDQENEDFWDRVVVNQAEERAETLVYPSIIEPHAIENPVSNFLKRSYVSDSSDKDAETFLVQDEPLQATSSLFDGNASAKRYRQLQEAYIVNGTRQSPSYDSSVHSNANKATQINCIQLIEEKFQPREPPYQPRLHKTVSEVGPAAMYELQRDFAGKAVISDKVEEAAKLPKTVDQSAEQKSKRDSSKDPTVSVKSGTKTKMTPKSSSNVPAATSDQKGFFVFHQSSHGSTPPIVCLLNAAVGICVFLVVVRELVMHGDWF